MSHTTTRLFAATLALLACAAVPAQAEDWQPWQGRTLAWQTLGGVGGAAAGALSGGLLAAALTNKNTDGFAALGGVILGFVVGGSLGTGVGVWAAGDLDGGNGGLGWSLLGGTLGTIGGFAIGGSLNQGADTVWMPFTGALVLGIGGAMVGYHVSASPKAPGPSAGLLRVSSDGQLLAGLPMVTPWVGPDGRVEGWRLGVLAGRF